MNFTENIQIPIITDNNIKKSDIYYIVEKFNFSNIKEEIYTSMEYNQTEITNFKDFLIKITEELNLNKDINATKYFIKNFQKIFAHLFYTEFKFKIDLTDSLQEVSIDTINNAISFIKKYKKVFTDSKNIYYINEQPIVQCHFDSTLHKLKNIKINKEINQIIHSIPKINDQDKNNLSLFVISNIDNVDPDAIRQPDNFLEFDTLIEEGSIKTFSALKKIIKNVKILNKHIKNNVTFNNSLKLKIEIINKNTPNIFKRKYQIGPNDSIITVNLTASREKKMKFQQCVLPWMEKQYHQINFNTCQITNLQIFSSDKI